MPSHVWKIGLKTGQKYRSILEIASPIQVHFSSQQCRTDGHMQPVGVHRPISSEDFEKRKDIVTLAPLRTKVPVLGVEVVRTRRLGVETKAMK